MTEKPLVNPPSISGLMPVISNGPIQPIAQQGPQMQTNAWMLNDGYGKAARLAEAKKIILQAYLTPEEKFRLSEFYRNYANTFYDTKECAWVFALVEKHKEIRRSFAKQGHKPEELAPPKTYKLRSIDELQALETKLNKIQKKIEALAGGVSKPIAKITSTQKQELLEFLRNA